MLAKYFKDEHTVATSKDYDTAAAYLNGAKPELLAKYFKDEHTVATSADYDTAAAYLNGAKPELLAKYFKDEHTVATSADYDTAAAYLNGTKPELLAKYFKDEHTVATAESYSDAKAYITTTGLSKAEMAKLIAKYYAEDVVKEYLDAEDKRAKDIAGAKAYLQGLGIDVDAELIDGLIKGAYPFEAAQDNLLGNDYAKDKKALQDLGDKLTQKEKATLLAKYYAAEVVADYLAEGKAADLEEARAALTEIGINVTGATIAGMLADAYPYDAAEEKLVGENYGQDKASIQAFGDKLTQAEKVELLLSKGYAADVVADYLVEGKAASLEEARTALTALKINVADATIAGLLADAYPYEAAEEKLVGENYGKDKAVIQAFGDKLTQAEKVELLLGKGYAAEVVADYLGEAGKATSLEEARAALTAMDIDVTNATIAGMLVDAYPVDAAKEKLVGENYGQDKAAIQAFGDKLTQAEKVELLLSKGYAADVVADYLAEGNAAGLEEARAALTALKIDVADATIAGLLASAYPVDAARENISGITDYNAAKEYLKDNTSLTAEQQKALLSERSKEWANNVKVDDERTAISGMTFNEAVDYLSDKNVAIAPSDKEAILREKYPEHVEYAESITEFKDQVDGIIDTVNKVPDWLLDDNRKSQINGLLDALVEAVETGDKDAINAAKEAVLNKVPDIDLSFIGLGSLKGGIDDVLSGAIDKLPTPPADEQPGTGGDDNQGGTEGGDDNQGGTEGGDDNQGGTEGGDDNQGGTEGGDDNQGGTEGGDDNQGGTEGGDDNQGGTEGGDDNQGGTEGGDDNQGGTEGGDDNQGGTEGGDDNQGGTEGGDDNQGGSNTPSIDVDAIKDSINKIIGLIPEGEIKDSINEFMDAVEGGNTEEIKAAASEVLNSVKNDPLLKNILGEILDKVVGSLPDAPEGDDNTGGNGGSGDDNTGDNNQGGSSGSSSSSIKDALNNLLGSLQGGSAEEIKAAVDAFLAQVPEDQKQAVSDLIDKVLGNAGSGDSGLGDALQGAASELKGIDEKLGELVEFTEKLEQTMDAATAKADQIIGAVQDNIAYVEDKLNQNIAHVEDKLNKLEDKVEANISKVEDKLQENLSKVEDKLQENLATVEDKVKENISKVEDKVQENVNKVDSEVKELAGEIKEHIAQNKQEHEALQGAIDAEAQARQDADKALQDAIDAEAQARQDADKALQDAIDAEAQARQDADQALQDAIDTEAQARQDADKALQDAVDAEAQARETADEKLQGAIDTEAQARQDADGALDKKFTGEFERLNNRIDGVEDRTDEVGAMAAAMATLHSMGYDPEAPSEIAIGVGQYRDKTGVAIGAFHYPNRDFMLNVSVSTAGDEFMGNIGATWKFGGKKLEGRTFDEKVASAEAIKAKQAK